MKSLYVDYPIWNLEQGLRVVRALQPSTRNYGYHLAIGGGVINKGQSDKDLDLYFLPMGGFNGEPKSDSGGMLAFLESLWGGAKPLASLGANENGFYKHAVQFIRMGGEERNIRQRIDCFIF
jgi:hypothetical protein